jgi:hypothetical protein
MISARALCRFYRTQGNYSRMLQTYRLNRTATVLGVQRFWSILCSVPLLKSLAWPKSRFLANCFYFMNSLSVCDPRALFHWAVYHDHPWCLRWSPLISEDSAMLAGIYKPQNCLQVKDNVMEWCFSLRLLICRSDKIVLWRIDPLLGKDLGTDEITAVAMQQRGKHASTTIRLLLETVLCKPLLGSCNSWTTTMETWVFPMWSLPRSYLEDNWSDPVSSQLRVNLWREVKEVCVKWPQTWELSVES